MAKRFLLIVAISWLGLCRADDARLTASLALKLDVPTTAGFGYRILQSDTLGNWSPIGEPLIGDGRTFYEHVSAGMPARFYRTERIAIQDLNPMLAGIRARRGMPALAAAVVLNGQIVGLGAVGERKYGADVPVQISDKWHIGSITKSMTATLAGMLVDEGRIR